MGWFSRKKEKIEYETPRERWEKLVLKGYRPGDATALTNYDPCPGGMVEFTTWGIASVCTPHRGEELTGYAGDENRRDWERLADERAGEMAQGERLRESMETPIAWAAPQPHSWAAPTPAKWEAPIEAPYQAPERIQVHEPAAIPLPTNTGPTFNIPLSQPYTVPMMDVGHGHRVPVFYGGGNNQNVPLPAPEEAPIPVETGSWLGALFGIGGRR
jgi:hypothetical protein